MRNSKGQFIKGEFPDCGKQFSKGYTPYNKGKTGWTNKGSFEEKEGGTPDKYRWKARQIMIKKLGRPLKKNEIVHHIDGDYTNNEESNLQLTIRSEHSKNHMTGRKLSQESIEKIRQSNIKTWRRNHP